MDRKCVARELVALAREVAVGRTAAVRENPWKESKEGQRLTGLVNRDIAQLRKDFDDLVGSCRIYEEDMSELDDIAVSGGIGGASMFLDNMEEITEVSAVFERSRRKCLTSVQKWYQEFRKNLPPR